MKRLNLVLQISIAAITISLLVMYLAPLGYATHPISKVTANGVVTLSEMDGVAVDDAIKVEFNAATNVLKIKASGSSMAKIEVTDIFETSDSIFVQGAVVKSNIAGLVEGTIGTCGYHLDTVACSGESPSNITAFITKLTIVR